MVIASTSGRSLHTYNNKLHFVAISGLIPLTGDAPQDLFRLESSSSTGSFAITAVTTVSCATVTASERTLTFTPRYSGINGQPISFSVVNELLPTTAPGPYTLRMYIDNPIITLKARQTGTPDEATFVYNWLAACGTTPPVDPTGSFAITAVTTGGCSAETATRRSLTFTPRYSGLNGQPISFSVVNELLPTTAPGPYTLRLYIDNPIITLKARQTGTPDEATFVYNWLAACGAGSRLEAAEPGDELSVRVLGNPVPGERVDVEIRGAQHQLLTLTVVDMQGHFIEYRHIQQATPAQKQTVRLGLPSGTYLLRVSSPTQRQTVRLVRE